MCNMHHNAFQLKSGSSAWMKQHKPVAVAWVMTKADGIVEGQSGLKAN